ncbi:cytochrome P450 [Streptomyces antimycoticus]|uniref:cytochrome P450 family protein n=1 Tax=Streptomyces TaxID=1883 RepID=UPI000F779AE4|nr:MULTISPECIES: cytochrome P450 [Streptomyces]AJZ83819.1 cytochrome P450 [Streptomyces sp. AgN23]RSS35266.1 cytochrome P450 [Streptomyces sp. WAC05858]WJD95514.1 cytochrome P450 [Streptomyces antimycoticus]WTA85699.1 cytochrome P450 [Streptomyces antimycoticus]
MQNTAHAAGTDGPELVDTAPMIEDLYPALATLREVGPVHRIAGTDGRPAWLVTRYEDVRRLLADPRLALDKRHAAPGNYSGFSLPPALDANLLNMDPPDHTRVRRLVVKAFTPGRVERMREPVRRIADELLDAIASDGRADLLTAYAGQLPIIVICDLLGVPQRDRLDFRAWSDALITPDPARPGAAKEAVGSMLRFYTELIAKKRAEPGDDLLSDLIRVRDDEAGDGDGRLTEDELTSLAFLILLAGYENTVHLIANSVLTLLDHPTVLQKLREDPSGLAPAFDELARYQGPASLAIRRFPLEEIEIGGVTIPAGETVLLSLASAHRDPAQFKDPDDFNPHLGRSGHLALGHGIHYCLGAPLARMEMEIALAALLRRFPGLRLDAPREQLRWRPSTRARGLISLPVAW